MTLEEVRLSSTMASLSTWKFLVCKTQKETVWLSVAWAWRMPMSQISTDAVTQLGHKAQLNQWYSARLCGTTGHQEGLFLAKSMSTLEIAPSEAGAMMWPPGLDCRRPDVIVGTDNWNLLEGFLRGTWDSPERVEDTLRELLCKWHILVVLQNGERMYLNLLQSGTVQRSRITARAAAKLGRESEESSRMHLVGMDGREIAISVDMVDTMGRLMFGEVLPAGNAKPDLVLSEEDPQRLRGMLLTGWRTEEDHLKGWASQGMRKDRVAQGI
jgi:hypothetical protein